MNVAYLEPLRLAVAHMRRLLLEPFDLGRWLVLGFVSWVAYLGSGGGAGTGWRGGGPGGVGGGEGLDAAGRELGAAAAGAWDWLVARPAALLLIVAAVVVVLVLVLLLLWLSSRFRLIFLEDVLYGRAAVVEPWGRLGGLGDSLFRWRLVFGLAVLAGTLLPVGSALALGFSAGWGWATGLAAVAAVLLAFAVVLVAVVVGALLDNFVVPVMYSHGLTATDAWRVLLPWLRREPGAFLLYLLLLLGLSIVVGVAILVVGLATCCVGLILVALPYVGAVVLLPVRVAYRSLGPLFLAQLDPNLTAVPVGAVPPAG